MPNIRITLMALTGMLLLNACQAPLTSGDLTSGNPAQKDSDAKGRSQTVQSAHKELSNAVANYEASYDNENLKISAKELQDALHSGLLNKHDQVIAHKYLAFIYCPSHRKKLCRNEFRMALELDPLFKLTAAEAGHPMWGPVFRSEKARYEKSIIAHNEHRH